MTNLPDRVKSANRAVFDRGASRYDEENPAHYNRVTQARIAEVLDIIRQGADGGRLLDAGCGTGNVLREARNRFSEVFQFDISFEMCRRAAGKGADVVCADFDHIPFPAETFSGVTAFSVIHHLVDQKTLLAETFRVLQPGGFFYADY
nr:class I SAM-dependent methyltransferase [bacterium]